MLQRELAALAPPAWRPSGGEIVVGAVFVAFGHESRAWAGAAASDGGRVVASAVAAGTVGRPYAPGLLALREGPLCEEAVRSLRRRPDVLLVNATGRDHPRGAGLAVHLGAVLDLPTVGVTDRPLVASAVDPGPRSGDAEPLELEGRVVGFVLRARDAVRSLVVHAAWRTEPETALGVVMGCLGRSRTPEPLREARRLARTERARAEANSLTT